MGFFSGNRRITDEMIEDGARALYYAGNERVGFRPWEMVADAYRHEALLCLKAALKGSTRDGS